MEKVGHVHDLLRTFACSSSLSSRVGLTTTELVAERRPCIYILLQNQFEQNHYVVYRLRRDVAPPPTFYDETSPERLAGHAPPAANGTRSVDWTWSGGAMPTPSGTCRFAAAPTIVRRTWM